MIISVVLVHNRNNTQNVAQINALLPKIITTWMTPDGPAGVPRDQIPNETPYWPIFTISGVSTPHEVLFYQILPFGATKPSNMDLLWSHNVIYGQGDNDKTGSHPRFINWLMKRGFDQGADVVVYIADTVSFTGASLQTELNALSETMVLREPSWGKVIAKKLFIVVGQLLEDLNFNASLLNLRQRLIAAGLERG
jgi:hypothetical protein